MKTKTPILIVVLLMGIATCLRTQAQNPERLLTEANKLYNESAYDSAAVVYESIINQGYSSATLYYNLGNTYYKLQNYPLAILYYEKSLKLNPNNEDTKHNIEIAKSFISDKIETVPELFIVTWWKRLSDIFTINTWGVLSLAAFGMLLSCLFIYLTTRTRVTKKIMFFSSLVLVVMTICCFSISIKKYNYIKSHNEGIIITPTITVKSSPSTTSVDLFVLHEGTKVKVIDNTGDWEKIKIGNGSIGWLPSTSMIKY